MKRFIPLLFALVLSGCAGAGVLGSIISGSVDNPVTPKAALQLHATFYASIVVPAAAYNQLGRCSVQAPPCSKQSVVKQLRIYVNATDKTLKQLDQWALGNKSLNGPALFQAATIAIGSTKDFALANGVIK